MRAIISLLLAVGIGFGLYFSFGNVLTMRSKPQPLEPRETAPRLSVDLVQANSLTSARDLVPLLKAYAERFNHTAPRLYLNQIRADRVDAFEGKILQYRFTIIDPRIAALPSAAFRQEVSPKLRQLLLLDEDFRGVVQLGITASIQFYNVDNHLLDRLVFTPEDFDDT